MHCSYMHQVHPAVHVHSAPFLVRDSLAWERNQHHTGNAHTSHMLFMLMWRMWVRERAFSQTRREDKLVLGARLTMCVYVSMCPHMCVYWGVTTAENKIISTSNENRKLRKKSGFVTTIHFLCVYLIFLLKKKSL